MSNLRLRFSPNNKSILVIPGDAICESGATPFFIARQNLVDCYAFNVCAMEHNWPQIQSDGWRERVRIAIRIADFSSFDECSTEMKSDYALVLIDLSDASISIDTALERLEGIVG